jgi:TolB-like protein
MKKITAISVLLIAAISSYAIYKSYTKSFQVVQKQEVREYGVRPADVISDPADNGVEIKKDKEIIADKSDVSEPAERTESPDGADKERHVSSPVLEMELPREKAEEPEPEVARLEFRDDALKKEDGPSPELEAPLQEEEPEKPEPEVARLEFRDDALKKEDGPSPELEAPLQEEEPEEPEPEVARLEFRDDALVKEIVTPPATVTPLVKKKPLDSDIVTDIPDDMTEMAEADSGDVPTEQTVVTSSDDEKFIADREPDKKIATEKAAEVDAKDSAEGPGEEIPEKTGPYGEVVLPGDNLEEIIVEPDTVLPEKEHFEDMKVPGDETVDVETEEAETVQETTLPRRSIEDLGESIALLPFDNLSEDNSALDHVMPVLRKRLEGKGFTLMYEEVLGDFLCEERVKRTGYISQPLARKGQDKLNIKAFVAGSVVAYADGDNPRVGILARMIDSSSGDIVWADYASLSGEEFTTILGLGTIKDIRILLDKTVDQLFTSLTQEHAEPDSGPVHRIAVMPFRNNTRYHGAGMIATYMFMVELFKHRQFDPAEFGDVRRTVVLNRIREKGNLDYTNMKAFSDHLDTGTVIVGSVDYYSNGKNGSSPPKVGITARLLDTNSRKILWYNTREVQGEEDIIAFDWGKIRTADKVAYKVVSSLIENMGESKWNGYEKNR